jgi:nitrite reductase/ring-hydroxylating ferredoxin subunit
MTQHVVAKADEIPPGGRKLVKIGRRELGIYNLDGQYYALANHCPHAGGSLCEGMVTGLVQSSGPGDYQLVREGEFVRCPLHGWEFDIRTGQSYCDPRSMRIRQYNVTLAPGETLAKGPYVAESFEVRQDENYLTVEL